MTRATPIREKYRPAQPKCFRMCRYMSPKPRDSVTPLESADTKLPRICTFHSYLKFNYFNRYEPPAAKSFPLCRCKTGGGGFGWRGHSCLPRLRRGPRVLASCMSPALSPEHCHHCGPFQKRPALVINGQPLADIRSSCSHPDPSCNPSAFNGLRTPIVSENSNCRVFKSFRTPGRGRGFDAASKPDTPALAPPAFFWAEGIAP